MQRRYFTDDNVFFFRSARLALLSGAQNYKNLQRKGHMIRKSHLDKRLKRFGGSKWYLMRTKLKGNYLK